VFVVMAQGDNRSLRKLFSAEPWSVRCSHAMEKTPVTLPAAT
jgi:hypothetical protein